MEKRTSDYYELRWASARAVYSAWRGFVLEYKAKSRDKMKKALMMILRQEPARRGVGVSSGSESHTIIIRGRLAHIPFRT